MKYASGDTGLASRKRLSVDSGTVTAMPARGWRSSVVVLSAVILAVGGCADSEPGATTTATSPTTSAAVTTTPGTTTTILEAGPQPLPADGFLEPGEYYTTAFEPTVLYTIEKQHILQPFQHELVTGLHSHWAFPRGSEFPYRGVAVHSHWSRLTPQEAEAELREFDAIEFGPTTQVEVAGFPGTQFEAFVVATSRLWQEGNVGPGEATTSAWWLQSNQKMRFIIVDTPAGTLLITIGADAEKWDDFLPVAEEILAGISFPDL
jgi:hypothetical protein